MKGTTMAHTGKRGLAESSWSIRVQAGWVRTMRAAVSRTPPSTSYGKERKGYHEPLRASLYAGIVLGQIELI